jgi:hypothetical protein
VGQRAQPLSPVTSVRRDCFDYHRGGRRGRRQVIMSLMPWAAHMLQWAIQWALLLRKKMPISKNCSQWGLRSEIRPHERGIRSNRRSAILR